MSDGRAASFASHSPAAGAAPGPAVGAPAGPRAGLRAGFWADAWARVRRRHAVQAAFLWLGVVALFAVIAPLVANGRPLIWRELDGDGAVIRTTSPLLRGLSAVDCLLLAGAAVAALVLAVPRAVPLAAPRPARVAWLAVGFMQGCATIVVVELFDFGASPIGRIGLAVAVAGLATWLGPQRRLAGRAGAALLVAVACVAALARGDGERGVTLAAAQREIAAGRAEATFTLVPWSPEQSRTELYYAPPMTTVSEHLASRGIAEEGGADRRRFLLGADEFGRDVLSQMIHACRLALSIGLVSTSIAILIGVFLGAVMGYFGGWVDLVLLRVVEVFMAIPVLFLLVAAAAVLQPNIYVMMALIGCVSWTGAARFTRAEFLKIRELEYVRAARGMGLPVRSILFRHMLPNGVTPVLVDASFGIAAAILAEATLSYLGLGPRGQASWGRLLAYANASESTFHWWLAVFPGLAIFLTVLAYNLIGEAMRDAIDPKLGGTRR